MRRIFVVAYLACGSPPPEVPHHAGGPGPPTVVLRLETEPAWTEQPAYSIELVSDGTLVWHGEGGVARVGEARRAIGAAQVQQVVDAFARAGFFDLVTPPRSYRDCSLGKCVDLICGETDRTTTRVTIRRGAQVHTYDWAPCGPTTALDEAKRRVEQLANDLIGHTE